MPSFLLTDETVSLIGSSAQTTDLISRKNLRATCNASFRADKRLVHRFELDRPSRAKTVQIRLLTPVRAGLLRSSMMRLPSAKRAVVDISKLREYCLDPQHLRGRHKARVFASGLNLDQRDAEFLRIKLLAAAQWAGQNGRSGRIWPEIHRGFRMHEGNPPGIH